MSIDFFLFFYCQYRNKAFSFIKNRTFLTRISIQNRYSKIYDVILIFEIGDIGDRHQRGEKIEEKKKKYAGNIRIM